MSGARVTGEAAMAGKFSETAFYKKHKYRLRRANDILSMVSALILILFICSDQSMHAVAVRHMVSDIEATALVTGLHTGLYKIDRKVLRAMAQAPRDKFVGARYASFAYLNIALPIRGHDHMLPEPFLSAMMINLMDIDPGDKVLEVGYGMGYETAVMAHLAKRVYSVRQEEFSIGEQDEFRPLENCGYANVFTRKGNGILGWSEAGPFDAILVKQALDRPPVALVRQLKTGGRLVMPLVIEGEPQQRLVLYTKKPDGSLSRRTTLYIRMTPLLKGKEA